MSKPDLGKLHDQAQLLVDLIDDVAKPKYKNVNALMDEPTYEQLRKSAYETKLSMSEIIRQALLLWFEQRLVLEIERKEAPS